MKNFLDYLLFIFIILTCFLVLLFRENILISFLIVLIGLFCSSVIIALQKKTYAAISFCISISGLLSLFFYQKSVLNGFNSSVFGFSASICSILIVTIIFELINRKRIKKLFPITVISHVVDLELVSADNKDCYLPILEYDFGGENYVIPYCEVLKSNIPDIGDTLEIYISDKDNSVVYFPDSKLKDIKRGFVSFVLIIVTILIIISLFR